MYANIISVPFGRQIVKLTPCIIEIWNDQFGGVEFHFHTNIDRG